MSESNEQSDRPAADADRPPTLEQPSFRSAPVMNPSQALDAARDPPRLSSRKSNAVRPTLFPQPAEVIDLNEYRPRYGGVMEDLTDSIGEDDATRLSIDKWSPTELPPVPAFYPLEKSSRLIEDSPQAIAFRVSECCRQLSVQAHYDNVAATASLWTLEHVEMHLAMWRAPQLLSPTGEMDTSAPKVVLELQRRKGDSIAFHRYARSLLDAAVGVDADIAAAGDPAHYSKHAQRLLQAELRNRNNLEHENAIIALEMAHGLLKKDRMDARQLGLESLCLLTDPRKTGMTTSILASHAVLLGTTQGVQLPGFRIGEEEEDDGIDLIAADEAPFQEIREAILSLVQFSKIGIDEEEADDDPDSEHMMLLHNLALAVLANALDVIENPDRYYDDHSESTPEDSKPRARLRTASSNDVTNEFLHQTEELSNKELLSTLISELGNAAHKPHNATLSAKCLGSMCRASDEAKKRAKELGAKNVVSTALDVGVRTHLKLETECKKVVQALERPDQEQQQQQRDPENE